MILSGKVERNRSVVFITASTLSPESLFTAFMVLRVDLSEYSDRVFCRIDIFRARGTESRFADVSEQTAERRR